MRLRRVPMVILLTSLLIGLSAQAAQAAEAVAKPSVPSVSSSLALLTSPLTTFSPTTSTAPATPSFTLADVVKATGITRTQAAALLPAVNGFASAGVAVQPNFGFSFCLQRNGVASSSLNERLLFILCEIFFRFFQPEPTAAASAPAVTLPAALTPALTPALANPVTAPVVSPAVSVPGPVAGSIVSPVRANFGFDFSKFCSFREDGVNADVNGLLPGHLVEILCLIFDRFFLQPASAGDTSTATVAPLALIRPSLSQLVTKPAAKPAVTLPSLPATTTPSAPAVTTEAETPLQDVAIPQPKIEPVAPQVVTPPVVSGESNLGGLTQTLETFGSKLPIPTQLAGLQSFIPSGVAG